MSGVAPGRRDNLIKFGRTAGQGQQIVSAQIQHFGPCTLVGFGKYNDRGARITIVQYLQNTLPRAVAKLALTQDNLNGYAFQEIARFSHAMGTVNTPLRMSKQSFNLVAGPIWLRNQKYGYAFCGHGSISCRMLMHVPRHQKQRNRVGDEWFDATDSHDCVISRSRDRGA
jgi:hypothetical protein